MSEITQKMVNDASSALVLKWNLHGPDALRIARDALEAALVSRPAIDLSKSCEWSIDDDSVSGSWDTGCGNSFILNDGTPSENGMKHCCYCGGKLIEGETK